MTEAEARVLLQAWSTFDAIEAWIAEQDWQAVAGGWIVTGE